jgi:hypothetical protein
MNVSSILPRPRMRQGYLGSRNSDVIPWGRWWVRGVSTHTQQRRSLRGRAHSKPKTVRDRLKSRTLPPRQTRNMDEQLLAERLGTRLEWARQTLVAGSEWLRQLTPMNDGTTTTIQGQSPPLRPSPKNIRLQYETPMDANWWFWNLLLAASPSLILAGYCEWVIQPKMKRLQQQQEKEESSTQNQGGTITASPLSSTPPPLTWSETWDMLLLWVQGHKPTTTPPTGDAPTRVSSATPTTTIPTSSQQLTERFHELQQQMLLLEQQLKNQQQQHDVQQSPSPASSATTRAQVQSPLQQRRQERQIRQTKGTTDIKVTDDAGIVSQHNPQQQQQKQQQKPCAPSTTSSIPTSSSNNDNNKTHEERDPLSVAGPVSGSWSTVLTRVWRWIAPPPRTVVSDQDVGDKDESPVHSPECSIVVMPLSEKEP